MKQSCDPKIRYLYTFLPIAVYQKVIQCEHGYNILFEKVYNILAC